MAWVLVLLMLKLIISATYLYHRRCWSLVKSSSTNQTLLFANHNDLILFCTGLHSQSPSDELHFFWRCYNYIHNLVFSTILLIIALVVLPFGFGMPLHQIFILLPFFFSYKSAQYTCINKYLCLFIVYIFYFMIIRINAAYTADKTEARTFC